MAIIPLGRAVISTDVDGAFVVVNISQIDEITVRIGTMPNECIVKDNFCVGQNTDVIIRLRAPETSDFSAASEAYFTVYSDKGLTAQVLQKTLSGGGISQPSEYEFSVVLQSSDTNMVAKRYFWECAIVTGGSKQKVLGQGLFVVKETGAFDA